MNLKRWTERTRPICPLNLKSGDKACYVQCVHSIQDGESENGDKIFGCVMADEMAYRLERFRREEGKQVCPDVESRARTNKRSNKAAVA